MLGLTVVFHAAIDNERLNLVLPRGSIIVDRQTSRRGRFGTSYNQPSVRATQLAEFDTAHRNRGSNSVA